MKRKKKWPTKDKGIKKYISGVVEYISRSKNSLRISNQKILLYFKLGKILLDRKIFFRTYNSKSINKYIPN